MAIDTVGAAPTERAGAASAVSEAVQELGTALGIAILGSVATGVYRVHLTENLPEDLSHARTATVLDSLGGLFGARPPFTGTIIAAARDAFTTGVQFSGALLATTLLLAAVLVAVALPKHPAG